MRFWTGEDGSVTTTTVAPECENIHGSDSDCDAWANAGHCEINSDFMHAKCSRSCGICSGGRGRLSPFSFLICVLTEIIVCLDKLCQDRLVRIYNN